jgi:hypothetical protein
MQPGGGHCFLLHSTAFFPHTRSRHQGWEPHKWTGKEPVDSPAAVTIQRKKAKTTTTHKTTKTKTKQTQNKKNTHITSIDCESFGPESVHSWLKVKPDFGSIYHLF